MFWCQRVQEGDKYCTCHVQWKNLKIINAIVLDKTLDVILTPEDGVRTTIVSLGRGQQLPSNLPVFEFSYEQHVRIEVMGGSITLIGSIFEGCYKSIDTKAYISSCIFSDIETLHEMYQKKYDKENIEAPSPQKNKKKNRHMLEMKKIIADKIDES